ncbi:MAG TPA: TetR/AcrR family transcriptional regulator C-terminal domain-containing protein [Desulfobacterales bacterium]|nr:TetR/AcrR family transcriptional regulator C-terminal domain-containing protein [Desulfobacterales bacterium]
MRTDSQAAAEPGGERLDPRVARTRRLLQDALMHLARARHLDDISIADIADAATVNRTTFYQHYADKETLLADALDEHAMRNGADLGGLGAELQDREHPPQILVHYLRHVAENADLYRLALGGHGSSIALIRLRERITQIAMEGIRIYGPSPAWLLMPTEVAAASIAGSIIGVLRAWLEREQLAPPDEAARWLWLALAGAFPGRR